MITLRFSRGDGVAGWAVRAYTWSWAAHVGFVLPTARRADGGRVLDAYPGRGVSRRDVAWAPTDRFFEADVPAQALQWAHSQIGCGYDYLGVLGHAIHRDAGGKGRWFCDAFVEWCCWKAGRPLLEVERLDRISPRDLLLSPCLRQVDPPTRRAR
jgi:hypothetical protein